MPCAWATGKFSNYFSPPNTLAGSQFSRLNYLIDVESALRLIAARLHDFYFDFLL
jgi:hypothetical protein